MDNSATTPVSTNQLPYPLADKSQGYAHQQQGMQQVALPQYDETFHQPQGNVQQQVIQHNNAHIQQPHGGPIFVTVAPQQSQEYGDVIGYCCLSFFSFLCCWPIGIFAMILALLFGLSKRDGNYEQAATYRKISLCLSIIAIVFGVILLVVVIAVNSSASSSTSGGSN